MAEEARTILTVDPGPALAALDQVRASIEGMEAEYRQLNKAGANLFDGAEKSTSAFIGDVDDLAATMSKAGAALQNLTRYERFLEIQQKKTTDPVLIKRYADEIARTRRAMSELRDQGVDAWQDIGREQQKSVGLFGGLRGAIARALPALSLTAVAASAIQAAGAYEQTRASFETFLKSAEKADALLGQLNEVSIRTPFTTEQFEQGARSLLAVNVAAEKVVPTLEQIATISAATGKDFNELATIYAKARTAGVLYAEDINQLIDAGIPIIEEFAAILDTTPDKVKKLASEGKISFSALEGAFQNLTREGGRFSGLLEKQSQTLPGLLSTLQGAFQNLLRGLGGGAVGDVFKRVIANATSLVNLVNKQFTPAQKSLAEQTRDVQAQFNAEIAVIQKGNFTQGERARLIRELNTTYAEYLPNLISEKASIEDIAKAQAEANKQFEQKILFIAFEEEYRKEVERSKEAAEAAFAAERQRVALQERVRKEGSQDNAQLEAAQKQLLGFYETTREVGLKTVEETPERLKQIESDFEGVAARLGTTLSELRKRFAQTDTAAPGGTSAAQTKQALDAERKRQELRLALLQEGRSKEIALEESRFEALKAELKKYFTDKDELQKQIEQADNQHRANLRAINERFDAEELTRLAQAQQEREALRLSLIDDGTQKEIAAEKARFERVKADLKRAFKDSADLPKLLEEAQAQHIANLNRINSAGLESILEADKAFSDQELALLEAQGEKVILLLRQRGASEEEIAEAQRQFDLLTQRKRLEAEIKFQQALLLATAGGDEERRKAIQGQIDLLNQQLENVNININTPNVDGKAKIDLKGLLGLSDKDAEAVREAANQIVNSINQITAARVAAAEEELRIAQDRVQAAEDALDRELELAEQGFASNVTLKRQELEQAQELEKQALEDRKKAQKQQAAVDAIQQSVSLITASANIFKALSGLGPIGVGLAIATIAGMFAAFAKVRLDAAKATRFREGGQGRVTDSGVIVGPAHSRGGVPLEVEGGEFFGTDGKRFAVVKKHLTGKHFDLLDAINNDDTPRIAAIAAQLGAGAPIYAEPGLGDELNQKRVQTKTRRQEAELIELRKSNALLKENNAYLRKMATPSAQVAYFEGGREERTDGLTKIIRTK